MQASRAAPSLRCRRRGRRPRGGRCRRGARGSGGSAGAQLHSSSVVWGGGRDPKIGGRGPALSTTPSACGPWDAPNRRLHGRGRLGEAAGDECPVETGQVRSWSWRPGGGGRLRLGDDQQPRVSRSKRWTIPGRSSRRAATRPCRAGGAVGERPSGWPGRGGRPGRPACRSPRATHPHTPPRDPRPARTRWRRDDAAGMLTSIWSSLPTRCPGRPGRRLTRTAPARSGCGRRGG